MLKLFKRLQKIVSQLEQICLKLGLKNDYTLAVSNFKISGKSTIIKSLKISSGDPKEALVAGT